MIFMMKSEKEIEIFECAAANGYIGKQSVTTIHRAITAPFAGSKDLGEWWVTYPGSSLMHVVKDEQLKSYAREKKLKDIGL
jgi:hypothetical protein